MQLFSIGVAKLNLDGTPLLVDGKPVETYGPDDVAAFANINSVTFSGGVMNACNTTNDPGFILPITEPIDGTWYNRLSVRIRYDGLFSLANAPGGGMNTPPGGF